jgi:hypothetical protein
VIIQNNKYKGELVMSNPQLNQEAGVDVKQRAKKAAIRKRRMKGGLRSLALALILAFGGFICLSSSGGAAAATLGTGLLAAATTFLFVGLIALLSGFFTS